MVATRSKVLEASGTGAIEDVSHLSGSPSSDISAGSTIVRCASICIRRTSPPRIIEIGDFAVDAPRATVRPCSGFVCSHDCLQNLHHPLQLYRLSNDGSVMAGGRRDRNRDPSVRVPPSSPSCATVVEVDECVASIEKPPL